VNSKLYLPAGSATTGAYDLEVTPESAGWAHTSLKIVTVPPSGSHEFATGDDEVIVLPLRGAVTVRANESGCELTGRIGVFAGSTDVAYVGIGQSVRLESADGGRFALCGARTDQPQPLRYVAAGDVPVERRGAGPSSRLVRNFGTPGTLAANSIIACEVITPGGNWSSYPAHKHDEHTDQESELEEIYYFEIAAGPATEPGLGYFRTSSSARRIELLEEVRDRDTVLVPYGWHGPAVAAPGHDMYYLNVMAGPGAERAWLISDDPDHGWIRQTWQGMAVDPRLPFYLPPDSPKLPEAAQTPHGGTR
jgi:5-deoxy-glucuronate isomerase